MRTLRTPFQILAVVVLTWSAAPAQTSAGKTDSPRLGYVFDASAQALRLISGIPGAATFGPALDVGAPMLNAAVSPLQNYALFTSAEEPIPAIMQFTPSGPVTHLIDGAAPARTIALSPTGKAALLSSPDAKNVQIVTGLPDQPVLLTIIDITALPGRLETTAISDGGVPVISVASDQEGSPVYLLSSNAPPRLLTAAGQVSAMVFFPNGTDLLVADRRNNQLILVTDGAVQANATIFAAESSGLVDPIGLAFSTDGRIVYLANAGANSVLLLDSGTGRALAAYDCSCRLSRLDRMLGKSVFRLSDDVSQPFWVYDGDSADPRIVFIPAAANGNGRRAQ